MTAARRLDYQWHAKKDVVLALPIFLHSEHNRVTNAVSARHCSCYRPDSSYTEVDSGVPVCTTPSHTYLGARNRKTFLKEVNFYCDSDYILTGSLIYFSLQAFLYCIWPNFTCSQDSIHMIYFTRQRICREYVECCLLKLARYLPYDC